MLKLKNKIALFLLPFLILFSTITSCSRGNPVNSAIEKSSKMLTNKNSKQTPPTETKLSDTSQQFENQVLDSIPYDTTATLPFTMETYAFKTKNYRDPFVSIMDQQRDGKAQIDIESAIYYGMIKGKNGKLALLKDASGLGFIFYEGQKIKNGILLKVDPDSVIFKLDEYGVVRNKVIKITKILETKKKK